MRIFDIFTTQEIKSIHHEFLKDLEKLCAEEAKLLEDEKKVVDLIKKYLKHLIEKPIFQKARWKKERGELSERFFRGKNAYADIINHFYTLIVRLRNNTELQRRYIAREWAKILGEERKEKEEIEKMPLFADELKRTDKNALDAVHKMNKFVEEILSHLNNLKNYFYNHTHILYPDLQNTSPNIIGYETTQLVSEFPDRMYRVLNQIFELIESKNQFYNQLKNLTAYEFQLEEEVLEDEIKKEYQKKKEDMVIWETKIM